MKIIHFFTLILSVVILNACNNSTNQKITDNKITGKLDNYKGGVLTFSLLLPTEIKTLDTIDVNSDGSFEYYADVNEMGFYRFSLGQNNFCNFILTEKDDITFTADANQMERTYNFTNSPENEKFLSFNKTMGNIYQEFEKIGKNLQQAQAMNDINAYNQAMQAQYALDEKRKTLIKQFIDENMGSFVNVAIVENLDPEKDFEYFEKVAQSLENKAPNSVFYKNLAQKVTNAKRLSVGYQAPEISLEDPTGKVVPLSSLRGNVVLIDFWASWCRPCRIENPNVVKLYKKYNNKGFEIYGVSLDKNKNAWEEAIKADNLTWTHVSDLKFWNSEGAKIYNVTAIPKTYLIDKDGKILAKDLRGDALAKKLDEIFSNS